MVPTCQAGGRISCCDTDTGRSTCLVAQEVRGEYAGLRGVIDSSGTDAAARQVAARNSVPLGPLLTRVLRGRLRRVTAHGSQGRPEEQSTSTRMTFCRGGRLNGRGRAGMPT